MFHVRGEHPAALGEHPLGSQRLRHSGVGVQHNGGVEDNLALFGSAPLPLEQLQGCLVGGEQEILAGAVQGGHHLDGARPVVIQGQAVLVFQDLLYLLIFQQADLLAPHIAGNLRHLGGLGEPHIAHGPQGHHDEEQQAYPLRFHFVPSFGRSSGPKAAFSTSISTWVSISSPASSWSYCFSKAWLSRGRACSVRCSRSTTSGERTPAF